MISWYRRHPRAYRNPDPAEEPGTFVKRDGKWVHRETGKEALVLSLKEFLKFDFKNVQQTKEEK